MGKLANHSSLSLVKGLLLGDPGAGKTGSLTSLVKAGYKIRIYDFDNLLGSLVSHTQKDCPDLIENVSFQTFTDKMKGIDMPLTMVGNSMKVMPFTDGTATGFSRALKQLTRWKTEDEDFGAPSTWGSDTVVVLDSLTSMAASAFRFVQSMNPAGKEPQAYFFAAQQLVENTLALLASESFATNVLVLAHIQYEGDGQNSLVKGFPRSIGSALNQKIAAYFNCVLMVQTEGSGPSIKRFIRSNSTGIVDLKNPVSFRVPDKMPIETGLADFFRAVTSKEK